MTHVVSWDELPMSVLYDVFVDAAMVLTGEYLHWEREATDTGEAADLNP